MMMDWIPRGVHLKEALLHSGFDLELGASEREVICERGAHRLYRYSPLQVPQLEETVLILPSLINRSYILDLLPERSFVQFLLQTGLQVFIVEWGVPGPAEKNLDLDQLVADRLDFFVDQTIKQSQTSDLHLIGHCLGGTVAAIYASRYPERIESLTLMTAPLRFSDEGLLAKWARHPKFDVDSFVEAYSVSPWPLMQASFQMLKPMSWVQKFSKLSRRYKDPEFLRSFLALETWSADNVALPGLVYRDLLIKLYRDNEYENRKLRIGQKTVGIDDLVTSTLDIWAEDDHIVHPQFVLSALEKCGRRNALSSRVSGGHVGSIIGKPATTTVWPHVHQWILREHTDGLDA